MMTSRRAYRDQIAGLAMEALSGHVIETARKDETGRPYVWMIRSPDRHSYWFFVGVLPGAIIQYGDIGGLIIESGYDLDWLDKAIDSLDYVLEKSRFRRDCFVQEMYEQYLVENGHAVSDFEHYADFMTDTGDTEAHEGCHDWPAEALWAYWALRRFVELRRADAASGAVPNATR